MSLRSSDLIKLSAAGEEHSGILLYLYIFFFLADSGSGQVEIHTCHLQWISVCSMHGKTVLKVLVSSFWVSGEPWRKLDLQIPF